MNNFSSIKTVFLAAAAALGLSLPAMAGQDPAAAAAPVATSDHAGLVGQSYVHLGYTYTDLTDTSVNMNGYNLTLNQNVREGLDTLLEYNFDRSENTGLGHLQLQQLEAGARAYAPLTSGLAKIYGETGLGWGWLRVPAADNQNSFVWFAGAGLEFTAAPSLSVTPFVRFDYANSFTEQHQWTYGVKANYWFSERAGVELKLARDNSRDMTYGIGMNFRY